MDIFTNFVLSGVLSIGVWILGAYILKRKGARDVSFVTWLKIWALTAGAQAFVFSILLSLAFPNAGDSSILKMLS